MATKTLRELVTVWGFDINVKPLQNVESSLKNIKSAAQTVGAIAVGSAAALFGMAEMVSRAGNEIRITADKIGLNIK